MTLATSELETITAADIVDARGVACPGPLLAAKQHMAAVPLGGVIEVWSSDPATRNDIGLWAGKVGHEYLGFVEDDGYDRVFVSRGK